MQDDLPFNPFRKLPSIMDKLTSVIAALDAGKLPSTQQISQFIDFMNDNLLIQFEPTSDLTSQGRLLADDLRRILSAWKALAVHKDGDNLIQEAIWHLTQSDPRVTTSELVDEDLAIADINSLRAALRTILFILRDSTSAEGTALAHDFFSFMRVALANAAELLETQAGRAKQSLRETEQAVNEGHCDFLGRDKSKVETEKDVKVKFENSMDAIKDAGATAIGAGQEAASSLEETADKTTSRLQEAFYKVTASFYVHPPAYMRFRYVTRRSPMKIIKKPFGKYSTFSNHACPDLCK